MAVTDASSIVSLFATHEANHAASRAWYERARQGAVRQRLFAPAILLAEVSSAFAKSMNDPARAAAVLAVIERREMIELVPVSVALARTASRLAREFGLRGCDSIYVALAQELDDVLVTFDEEQLRRGAAVVRVERPA